MSNKLSVRVRMYRQGLGDCFLLTFSRQGQSDYNLMIDCGLFQGTKNGKIIMTDVAKSVKETTNGHLNAVVLTHDHYDHTSGFTLAKEIYSQADFKFDEIWCGWTEDKNHPKYQAVRDHFHSILKGLRVALNSELKNADEKIHNTVNDLVNDFFGIAEEPLAAAGSSKIWDYLLNEKGAEIKCHKTGSFFELDANQGIRIYILGPPEDFQLIETEEPSKNELEDESYRHSLRMGLANSFLAAATADDNSIFDANSYSPFDEDYRIDAATAQKIDFFKDIYEATPWRKIDDDWLATAGELALWMDDFTNNTCLAIAIELVESKKVLIFPGDAQFGNWISWQKLTWDVPDGNGGNRKVKASDLLANTVFYKVGHHGSHNATLRKSGLEMMNVLERELVAMIPTNREFAKTKGNKEKGGWQMPEKKLMERLEQKSKGRVILADDYGGTNSEKKPLKDRCKKLGLSQNETSKFLEKVKFGGSLIRDAGSEEPLYVEYTIEG